MKRIRFIVNPQSGVRGKKKLESLLEKYLNSTVFQYDLVYTQYPHHGIQLAKEAVKLGIDIVVAVGGDGSANDVVNGIYGTSVGLGIIPRGSGNGFARSLRISRRERKAIQTLNNLRFKSVDIGSADGHLFISNTGVGFDTFVIRSFDEIPHRGIFTYLYAILKNLFHYTPLNLKITTKHERFEREAFMLTAANVKQLGYGFQIAPRALSNDSFLNLVILSKFSFLSLPLIIFQALTGKLHKNKNVETLLVRQVKIQHPKLKHIQFDGEVQECKSSIIIKILPKKLKVLV